MADCEGKIMNANVDRYEKLLKAAFEAHQLKYELKRKLREVSDNITAYELKSLDFNNEGAKKAFKLLSLSGVSIEKREYVKSSAVFKNIKIHLHCHESDINGQSIGRVIEELGKTEIYNSGTNIYDLNS